jgi:pantoate--beta-alanine ligase
VTTHHVDPLRVLADGLVAVIGAGRIGQAVAASLRAAGAEVRGPLGRGARADGAAIVLLAVPDSQIADAAAGVPPGPFVGHFSGATTLDPLEGHRAFSIHPLTSVADATASFAGVPAAVAGATADSLRIAEAVASELGMLPFRVADADRAAYHAAASIASNFLVTLEAFAEELAATAGVDRHALGSLVRATVDNWQASGSRAALTGPIVRGDEATVARQRAAVAERLPGRVALFDALAEATGQLAASGTGSRDDAVIVVRTVDQLRAELRGRRGGRIGLIPTMGALHEGHLSLVRAARSEVDTVVMSIFVNPTQFNETADLAAYPRTEQRDVELAAGAGVDIVFAPDAAEIYPEGFATTVSVTGVIAETLEGAERGRGHFDGVATVVSKLLLAALPDSAYFGAKDAQQVAVVRRMVADLGIPVRIVVCPTSRDEDGLARSSRNSRLTSDERARALSISLALSDVADAVASGVRDPDALRARAVSVLAHAKIAPEYVAFVDPDTFEPVTSVDGTTLAAIAARVGETRLIDNTVLTPGDALLTPGGG